jgi:hypothetical protein
MSAFIICCLKNLLQLLAKTFFAPEITEPELAWMSQLFHSRARLGIAELDFV